MASSGYLNPFHTLAWEIRQSLWESVGYTPQPYQERFHQAMGYRVKVAAGGEGSAKTMTAVHDYAHEAVVAPLRVVDGYQGKDGFAGRWFILGPDYKATKTAFDYLAEIWRACGLVLPSRISGSPTRPYTMTSETNVEVVTLSVDNIKAALATRGFTGGHITEAAQTTIEAFDRAIGRTQRWGSGLIGPVYLDGRFEDGVKDNWYAEKCREWALTGEQDDVYYQNMPSWENKYMYPGGRNDPAILAVEDGYRDRPRLFRMMYGGEPLDAPDNLWSEYFIDDLHVSTDAEYNPDLPIDFYHDPATHRAAGLFVQWPSEHLCYVFDELVTRGKDFHKYREAFLAKGYYDKARGKRIELAAADVHINDRQGMQTALGELWAAPIKDGGLEITFQSMPLAIEDGVQVLATGLQGKAGYEIRIHPRCKELIHDLKHERRINGQVGMAANKGNDDCRKALSYGLRIKKGLSIALRERPPAIKTRSNLLPQYRASRKSVGSPFG